MIDITSQIIARLQETEIKTTDIDNVFIKEFQGLKIFTCDEYKLCVSASPFIKDCVHKQSYIIDFKIKFQLVTGIAFKHEVEFYQYTTGEPINIFDYDLDKILNSLEK